MDRSPDHFDEFTSLWYFKSSEIIFRRNAEIGNITDMHSKSRLLRG